MSAADPRTEAETWIPFAESDIAAVRLALGADPPLLDVAAYHCQQGTEKLLKALLVLAGQPIRKTHDLQTLASQAEMAWPGLSGILGSAVAITSWGFAFRYPHAGPAFTPPPRSEIEVVLRDIERLHRRLRELLARG